MKKCPYIAAVLLLAGCASARAPRLPEFPADGTVSERQKAYDTYKLDWLPLYRSVQQGWMSGNDVVDFKGLDPLLRDANAETNEYYKKAQQAKKKTAIWGWSSLGLFVGCEGLIIGSIGSEYYGGAATFGGLMAIGSVVCLAGQIISSFTLPKQMEYMADAYNDDLYRRLALDRLDIGIPVTASASEPQDGKAPTIVIISPQVKRGLNVVSAEKTLLVEGRAVSNAGIHEVKVNDVEAVLSADGEFSARVKLAPGDNRIVVAATDVKNGVSSYVFQVTRTSEGEASGAVYPGPVSLPSGQKALERKGKDYALLFATDSYGEWEKLSNPENDAEALAVELRENYGFEVDVVVGATQERILRKLYDYAARSYRPDDQLFVFFAGHGQFDEVTKMGYVVASDSSKSDIMRRSYISHSEIRDRLDSVPCDHIMLAMDVCFGGTFDRAIALRGSDDPYADVGKTEFIQRKLLFKTRKYLTSGGKAYVSDGRPGEHSPFAARLLEALRGYGGKDGILTLGELLASIEGANPQPMSGGFGSDEPGSDFIFVAR